MQHHEQTAAALSLPPLVEGPRRGCLRLSLGPACWAPDAPGALRHHPGPLEARLHFWGDPSGGQRMRLPAAAAAAASSAASLLPAEHTHLSLVLRTGPKYLTRYLRDAGALAISLEPVQRLAGKGDSSGGSSSGGAGGGDSPHPPPAPLALATVGLLALDVHAPIAGDYPLVLPADSGEDGGGGGSRGGAIVGSLPVRLELDYSSEGGSGMAGVDGLAPVSSFELQEHLASAAAAEEEAGPAEAGGDTDCSAALAAPTVCCDLAAALADGCAAAAAWGKGKLVPLLLC